MKPEAEFEADETRIIDGSDAVLGRLASTVSSALLDGEKVAVVNAEDVVVSGEPKQVFERYKKKVDASSDKGPHHPRRPDGLLRRSIRGMVPHKRKRGKEAMSNLRVYVDVPYEYDGEDFEEPDETVSGLGRGGHVSLGEISEKLGAKVTWQ